MKGYELLLRVKILALKNTLYNHFWLISQLDENLDGERGKTSFLRRRESRGRNRLYLPKDWIPASAGMTKDVRIPAKPVPAKLVPAKLVPAKAGSGCGNDKIDNIFNGEIIPLHPAFSEGQ